jgi:hypothetical protein
MAKGQKQKTPSIWDRPPFPQQGDADKKEIWTAVGAAISAWGEYESALGRLFTIFIAGEFPSPQAKRAFGEIRSFEGRRDLLRGASEAFFHYRRGTSREQVWFKAILKEASHAVERRNDLAHGIALAFTPEGKSEPNGFCLLPSYYDSSKRDPNDVAEFAYRSASINVFASGFKNLVNDPMELGSSIISRIRERRKGSLPQWPW